ncbi:MAG: hypothetical protein J5764_00760 [Bacteroidales bacterium]|nr:hypothetical protein [Bacteroidales bacterium]
MRLCILIASIFLGILPGGKAYVKQLQPRDSVLIADQLEYGFQLDSVGPSTALFLPDFNAASNDTLTLVRGWQLDTLRPKGRKARNLDSFAVSGSVVLAPFEPGTYHLPDIPVLRKSGARVDTLLFEGLEVEVKTIPVDTATFVPHDLKGQIKYPLTFSEIYPYVLGGLLLAALIVLAVWLLRRRAARKAALEHKDPAYIVALRKLDKFRGEKHWAPEKQKAFYSGITDALKEYMEDRFKLDAPEMTTAELFDALKGNEDIDDEMMAAMKGLFETADFVKFAKHTAPDNENAAAVPLAVNFVTSTWQAELVREEAAGARGGAE